jgi:hypothetical protein
VFVRPLTTGASFEVAGEMARRGEAPQSLRIEGPPQVVRDSDGFDRYVVKVVPPEAPAGTYSLALTFRDPGTGRTERSEAQIVLTIDSPALTPPRFFNLAVEDRRQMPGQPHGDFVGANGTAEQSLEGRHPATSNAAGHDEIEG